MRHLPSSVRSLAAGALICAGIFATMPNWAQAEAISDHLAVSGLAQLAPSGTNIDQSKTFSLDSQTYVFAVTKGTLQAPSPWMIVAKKTSQGAWDPMFIAQANEAFNSTQIFIGPKTGDTVSIGASFLVDAATGILSNVYTLKVTPDSVQIMNRFLNVVEESPLKVVDGLIQLNGLNLQVDMGMQHGEWVTKYTPLRSLLANTDHPIGFVMGWAAKSPTDGTLVKKLSIVGPSVIYAKVGQTVSFVPLNAEAVHSMLDSQYENGYTGISVYAASPGSGPLSFYQAAQVLQNDVRLDEAGTFTFGIAPPNYYDLKPNAQSAIVKVIVSK